MREGGEKEKKERDVKKKKKKKLICIQKRQFSRENYVMNNFFFCNINQRKHRFDITVMNQELIVTEITYVSCEHVTIMMSVLLYLVPLIPHEI